MAAGPTGAAPAPRPGPGTVREPPGSGLRGAAAKSGRQLATSISQPRAVLPGRERRWGEPCRRLSGQRGRKRALPSPCRRGGYEEGTERAAVASAESVSRLTPRDSPGLRPGPREGGHTAPASWGPARRAVLSEPPRLEAELKVSSRGPVSTPPPLTPGAAAGQEGGTGDGGQARRGARPRPSPGPPAAAGRPCGRRGRERGPRRSGWMLPHRPHPVLGETPPLPPPPTCTARLRKVPASAANFLTLKSIMFILRRSRAELPADLAGRRRRRGRAGAPGGTGAGRRGEWREAAPAPRPQLSFPSRAGGGGSEGGARGEDERLPAAPASGRRSRDAGPVPSGARPLTSALAAAGEPETDWRSGLRVRLPSGGSGRRRGAEPLWRGDRGNSDPFRTVAALPRGAPGTWLAPPVGRSASLGGARRGVAAAALRCCG